MSTIFSGGTYVNTTFTGDTKANIISAIQTQLTNAGWSVVSGSGTTNLLMQTALGADGYNQGRVRFKDNSGSCVQVTIENVSGGRVQTTGTGSGGGVGQLFPAASKTFRILASKYRFEVFTPGVSAAREFVCAGILAIPTPYVGIISEAIYVVGNATSDSDTTNRGSFRDRLYACISAGICNNSLMITGDSNFSAGMVTLRVPCNAYNTNLSYYNLTQYGNGYTNRWHDGAIDMADALMSWGTASQSDEGLLRGQVYDWTIVSDSFVVDTTDSWSDGGTSHNWWALTGQNTGSSGSARGTIFVATS